MNNAEKRFVFVMGALVSLLAAGCVVASLVMRSWEPLVGFGIAMVASAVTVGVLALVMSYADRRWP